MTRPTRPVRMPRRLAAALALAAVAVAGCTSEDVDDVAATAEDLASDAAATLDESAPELDAQTGAVVTALEDAGLTTLASAVSLVDFSEIAGSDEFTFFAPNDEAFLSLTADELADLTDDLDLLTSTLQGHVVDQAVTAEDVVGLTEVTTVAGTTLPVEVDGDTVTVGGATVVETDIMVGDGVVHVIDAILAGE